MRTADHPTPAAKLLYPLHYPSSYKICLAKNLQPEHLWEPERWGPTQQPNRNSFTPTPTGSFNSKPQQYKVSNMVSVRNTTEMTAAFNREVPQFEKHTAFLRVTHGENT
jgi:hypothetical protein